MTGPAPIAQPRGGKRGHEKRPASICVDKNPSLLLSSLRTAQPRGNPEPCQTALARAVWIASPASRARNDEHRVVSRTQGRLVLSHTKGPGVPPGAFLIQNQRRTAQSMTATKWDRLGIAPRTSAMAV